MPLVGLMGGLSPKRIASIFSIGLSSFGLGHRHRSQNVTSQIIAGSNRGASERPAKDRSSSKRSYRSGCMQRSLISDAPIFTTYGCRPGPEISRRILSPMSVEVARSIRQLWPRVIFMRPSFHAPMMRAVVPNLDSSRHTGDSLGGRL